MTVPASRPIPLPRRFRIQRAIERCRELRGESLVLKDISVDAAYMIIVITNRKRTQKPRDEIDLKRLVTNVVHHFEFDPGRARVYTLVTMQYYTIMSQLRAWVRRQRKLGRHARQAQRHAR